MSSTDDIDVCIPERLASLEQIAKIIDSLMCPVPKISDEDFIEMVRDENSMSGRVLNLQIQFESALMASADIDKREALLRCNIVGKLSSLESDIKNTYNKLAKQKKMEWNDKIVQMFEMLRKLRDSAPITYKSLRIYEDSDNKTCNGCGKPVILTMNARYECTGCMMITPAYGVVTSDAFVDHTLTKSSSSYKTEENCELWLLNIQGIEPSEIPDNVISKLRRKMLDEDIIDVSKVTYTRVRQWLKDPDIDETKYNNHIPKIRYILTGIAPVKFTDVETSETIKYLRPLMSEYNKVKSKKLKKRKNSLYQPYLILKVIEQVFDRSSKEKERRFLSIVSNIHFQGKNTISRNDALLTKINIGIKFSDTDIAYYKTHANVAA